MATNNIINSPIPTSVAKGGTGLTSLTDHAIQIGAGTSSPTQIVLGAGQVLIGTTASDPVAANLTAGSNVTINSTSGSIQINATANVSFSWASIAGTSQNAAVNTGYFPNNAGVVSITLPSSPTAGDIIKVMGFGAGGWSLIAQPGITIKLGAQTTSSGGSISSTNNWDSITVVASPISSIWLVDGWVGNLTFT